MNNFKDSMKLFNYNRSSIIVFEIIYKVVVAALMTPIIYAVLNYSVKAAGMRYLMSTTVKKYFMAPTTYVAFFCLLVILSMFVLINISGLIYAMEASHRNEKTNPLSLLFKSIGNALRVLNPKNMKVIIYVLFILPFTYTSMISGTLLINKVPEFIITFLKRNKLILAIAIVVYLIMCIVAMYRIFSLNYFAIYKMNYSKSIQYSKKVVGKNIWRIIWGLFLWNLLFTAILILFGGLLSTLVAGLLRIFVNWKKARFLLNTIFSVIFMIIYIILNVISTPIIYAYICNSFYKFDTDEEYGEFEEVKKRRHKPLSDKQIKTRNSISFVLILVISLVLDAEYIYMSLTNKTDFHILYPTRASVTAHRGDSEHAPENTMAAFALAYENDADIIEIDIRQTNDGRYIVMHDESLYRTTGDHHNVGEVNLKYIQNLDAGSSFSQEYAGERIPTLEEVIEFAIENDIYLNIEMKSAKTDQNYVQGLVDIIYEYEFQDQCMVASDIYDEIVELKTIAPEITSLYIMHYAFSNIGTMEYVDAFSIKANYISAELVKDIHKNNKKVYAWTVDTESQIKRLLLNDVDGIISNNPYNTKNIVYNANSGLVVDILSRICANSW